MTYKKSFRPWIVLIGCCLLAAVGFSVPATMFSVFQVSLMDDLGVPLTAISLYYTILTLVSCVSFILGTKINSLMGTGRAIALFGALGGLSYVALALVPSLPMVYVAAVVMGLAYPIVSLFTIPVVLGKWFFKYTGTMVSVALAFAGVGSAIMSPIVTNVIAASGWQTAMLGLGVLYIVVQVVVGLFIIRDNPLDLGILPFGATQEQIEALAGDKSSEGSAAAALPGAMLREVAKTPSFFVLALVILLLGVLGSLNTNVSPIVTTSGYSATVAAMALSLSAIGNIIGKPFMGIFNDKFGSGAAQTFAAILTCGGLVLYGVAILNVSVPLIYAAAFIAGCGCCCSITMPPLITRDAYGSKDYSNIYGIMSAIRSIGGAVGAPIVAGIYDGTGSYFMAVVLLGIVCLATLPLLFAGVSAARKKWAHAAAE